jgi:hypothetical protein
MRLILPAGCLLVLIVLVCGCTQSPSGAPLTAAATSSIPDPVLPGTSATPHPRMAVNVTAEQTATEVIVKVTGGADTSSLRFLNIRITNHDGSLNLQTISSPETGKPYRFQYRGYASAARINIIGTFADGYQQTLLMTTL